jgi:hypothetical protein
VVAKTVLDVLDAYCLVRAAPRPLVAPTMSALTIVLKVMGNVKLRFWVCGDGTVKFDVCKLPGQRGMVRVDVSLRQTGVKGVRWCHLHDDVKVKGD